MLEPETRKPDVFVGRERERETLVALLARAPASCYPSCMRCDRRPIRNFPDFIVLLRYTCAA
jgi:hypothetical protein